MTPGLGASSPPGPCPSLSPVGQLGLVSAPGDLERLYNARIAQTPGITARGAAHPLSTSASVHAHGTHGVGWEGLH